MLSGTVAFVFAPTSGVMVTGLSVYLWEGVEIWMTTKSVPTDGPFGDAARREVNLIGRLPQHVPFNEPLERYGTPDGSRRTSNARRFEEYVAERGRSLLRLAHVLTGDAQRAEDLTQTALGISRDDAATFLGPYVQKGILAADPFIKDHSDIQGPAVAHALLSAVAAAGAWRPNRWF